MSPAINPHTAIARRGRPALLVTALGAVLWLVLAGCSSGSSGTTDSRTVVPTAKRGEPIALSGTTLDGTPLNLAALRGKPVVLNIWGSWCSPCRKEAPDLQAASTQLAGKASFVGIDTRDAVTQAQAFQRHFGVTYPSLFDKGDLLLGLRGAVGVQAPPVTLVLDAQGRIAGRFVGGVTTLTLVDLVSDVSKTS